MAALQRSSLSCVLVAHFQWAQRGEAKVRAMEIVVPPVAVASSSAKSLWSALREHPLTQPTMRFKTALLDVAVATPGGLGFDIDQTDNASGNELYFAAACAKDNPSWVKDRVLCLNHQNHHCVMTVVTGVLGSRW